MEILSDVEIEELSDVDIDALTLSDIAVQVIPSPSKPGLHVHAYFHEGSFTRFTQLLIVFIAVIEILIAAPIN